MWQVLSWSWFSKFGWNTAEVFAWNRHSSWIKIRKSTRFTKCTTFEQLTAELGEASSKGLRAKSIMNQKREHIDFVAHTRREYRRASELGVHHPSSYVSIVVYGAEHTNFSLPRSTTVVNEQIVHGSLVHLVDILRYSAIRNLRLFTMIDEHEKGSNHVVDSLHSLINEIE